MESSNSSDCLRFRGNYQVKDGPLVEVYSPRREVGLAGCHESSMSQRPMLDADSFQKLLEAAWVLQLERDRRVSELPEVQSPAAPTEQPSVFVSRVSLGEVLEA